jgi:hypothetical protein
MNSCLLRAVGIPHTGQLATRSYVLTCSTQDRAHDRLPHIKFGGVPRIVGNAHNNNLILTIAKRKMRSVARRSKFGFAAVAGLISVFDPNTSPIIRPPGLEYSGAEK